MSKPSAKPARTKTVWIPTDDEAIDAFETAKEELRSAQQSATVHGTDASIAALAAAKDNLAVAREAVRESSIKFLLKAVGRRKYEALVNEHPATEAQKEKMKVDGGEASWNEDTFPAALLSAAMVDPAMSVEEVQSEIIDSDDWNAAEVMTLFLEAYGLSTQRRVVDLGNG